MTFCFSIRNITLSGAILTAIGLSACAAQNGSSRYGDCPQPCMPVYQQPAYVESYYQVPVAPLPRPAPAPLPAPKPAPVIVTAPAPAISCPHDTVKSHDGTCLQLERPVYTPPVIGYTPDPVAPPRIYKPYRK